MWRTPKLCVEFGYSDEMYIALTFEHCVHKGTSFWSVLVTRQTIFNVTYATNYNTLPFPAKNFKQNL